MGAKVKLSCPSPSLPRVVLYGMVSCLDENYTVASDLFEMATTCDPTNSIAWTMRGRSCVHCTGFNMSTVQGFNMSTIQGFNMSTVLGI